MFKVFALWGMLFSVLIESVYANDIQQQALEKFRKLQRCVEEKPKNSINCENILQQLSEIKKEDLPTENQTEFTDLKAKISNKVYKMNMGGGGEPQP